MGRHDHSTPEDGGTEINPDVAAIGSPRARPEGRDARNLGATPPQLTDKQIVLEVGDNVNWTSNPIYWGDPVRVDHILDDPLADFYMFYSEDHSDGAVGLAYADDPMGPWTDYDANPVIDFYEGQDETPSVLPDPAAGVLRLFPHTTSTSNAPTQFGQATYQAVSNDETGTSFTNEGFVAVDLPPWMDHNGYFKPFRLDKNGTCHAWMLTKATSEGMFGTAFSYDGGATWTADSRPLSYGADLVGTNRRVEWNTTNVMYWNGRPWWLGLVKDMNTAGTDRGSSKISVAPMYGVRDIGRPTPIGEPTEPWEGTSLYSPSTLVEGGEVFVCYTTDDSKIAMAKMGRAL